MVSDTEKEHISPTNLEKYVAIDLDGTIAEYDSWKGLNHIGEPKPDSKRQLERLKRYGFKIIIHTCRSEKGFDHIKDYFEKRELPYDYINSNPEQPETAGDKKVFAHYYVDDRSPNYQGLSQAVDRILELEQLEDTVPEAIQ